jgi:hypothetical protein
MRALICISFLFLTSLVNAATINLNTGDTIKVLANSETTVTCNGTSSVDCNAKVALWSKKLDLCLKTEQTDYCLNLLWPQFKSNNPTCIDEGSQKCLDVCTVTEQTSFCLNKCK